jgi:3-isopropylmalate dehydrogenase
MATTQKLLLLPGDGIGVEAMGEVERILSFFNEKSNKVTFDIERDLVGGCAIDKHGVPLTNEALDKAQASDAVLFGSVGGPKWDDVPFKIRPEAGLLRLRKEMDLFANLRPAICYPALAEASSLRREFVEGLDILILRELTGGTYFGEPKEIVTLENGEKRAVDTTLYTTHEIERVVKVAFDLARTRRNKVHSAEKRNVMKTGVLWAEVSEQVHKEYAPDVEFEPILADNCAMQLVREPVHGSAPDIAGQNKANPIATISSFGMSLRYSFGLIEEADMLDKAISNVLAQGYRTSDIMQPNMREVGTTEMGEAILEELSELAGA